MKVATLSLILAAAPLGALGAMTSGSRPATQAAAPKAAEPAGATVTGTVLESMDASSYTYLKLKTAQGETWAAVQKSVVAKGSKVTIVNAVPMDGFESKTLHRTFDHIVFGTLATGAPPAAGSGASALPPGHPAPTDASVKSMVAAQHAAAAAGPDDVGTIKVAKAAGPGGRTVAEIYGQRAALKGKEVSVRGQVVKFTPNVMGKNWIHLRDGSGSHAQKDDDITVTTTGAAAIGDVVVVTGTVRLDRDFGAGYAYPVMIEEARLSK